MSNVILLDGGHISHCKRRQRTTTDLELMPGRINIIAIDSAVKRLLAGDPHQHFGMSMEQQRKYNAKK